MYSIQILKGGDSCEGGGRSPPPPPLALCRKNLVLCTCTCFLSLQVMVNSEVSGVAFSRHPLTPLSSNTVLVEAVYGLGEGLVSGELEADRYEVHVYTLILVYVHAGGGGLGTLRQSMVWGRGLYQES